MKHFQISQSSKPVSDFMELRKNDQNEQISKMIGTTCYDHKSKFVADKSSENELLETYEMKTIVKRSDHTNREPEQAVISQNFKQNAGSSEYIFKTGHVMSRFTSNKNSGEVYHF